MIIQKPHLCTVIEIWHPRYSDKWKDEPRVLLSAYRVHHASPVILIKFTKAKSLAGGRYAIRREKAEKCERVTNGKIPCYAVPLSQLEPWVSEKEDILNAIAEIGW